MSIASRVCLVSVSIFAVAAGASTQTLSAIDRSIARGDAAWERRSEGYDPNGYARLEPVLESIAAYENALEADPDALEAHWRLLRAWFFAGEFTTRDDATQIERFERGKQQAERSFEALDRAARDGAAWRERDPSRIGESFTEALHPAVARIQLWSALLWASWARETGVVAAVRSGAILKMRRQAERVIALDGTLEGGAAHRLLSRLHAQLPRIPFYTSWVDRDQAFAELERALATGPEHPGNRVLKALTWLDLAPERRGEALAILESVAQSEPTGENLVEQLAIRRAARERLAKERERSSAG